MIRCTRFDQVGTHLASCVLQQIDPLALTESADSETVGSERYTDGGTSRQAGTAYSEVSPPGRARGISASAVAVKNIPVPSFEKPRCVSGKLPGGLCYARATLPPADAPSKGHGRRGSPDDGGEGGVESDEDGGGGHGGAEYNDSGGGGGGVAKSFTTGSIVVCDRRGSDSGGDMKAEEK